MKILVINNTGISCNKEEFFVDLRTGLFAKELATMGHEVTFFGQFVPLHNNSNHTFGVIHHKLAITGARRKKNKLFNYVLIYLKGIIEVYKSDYVYLFYPNSLKYLALISKILHKPFGLYIRGMDDRKGKFPHFLYRNAAAIFSVSDYFTDYINQVRGTKIAYTIRPMTLLTEKDIVYDRLYNAKPKYRLLYIGRMTNDKGLRELLHAVSILVGSGGQIDLTLVGDGESLTDFQQLCEDLNISSHVSFKGGVYETERIRDYFVGADIFILPTYHEGFPRTLYEAMAFGTPIITTFVGGIPSVMQEGLNCMKIEPKSINSIIDAVKVATDNYSMMINYAKNGTNTIKQILDPSRLSHAQDLNEKLKKIYE